MFLLDTNVCIRLLNATSDSVVRRFRTESPASIRLCSVVKAELCYGARKSRDVTGVFEALDTFFGPLESLPFDDECAHEYGVVRSRLELSGTPIGANDLLIASIALRYDVTLVTHNRREFSRVPGLRLDDWEEEPPPPRRGAAPRRR
jgi:tRNA(fMet)-specific endonuclease VapC